PDEPAVIALVTRSADTGDDPPICVFHPVEDRNRVSPPIVVSGSSTVPPQPVAEPNTTRGAEPDFRHLWPRPTDQIAWLDLVGAREVEIQSHDGEAAMLIIVARAEPIPDRRGPRVEGPGVPDCHAAHGILELVDFKANRPAFDRHGVPRPE